MAVCGRCLICGYKFNGRLDDGTEPDVAIRWPCTSEIEECARARESARERWGEDHEHKICTTCHDSLVSDSKIADVGAALLALVSNRVLDSIKR